MTKDFSFDHLLHSPNRCFTVGTRLKRGGFIRPRVILGILSLQLFAPSGRADTTVYAEVLESMMEAHADNMLTLIHAVGPDYGASLHFTTSVDVVDRSFTITLDPGQNYLGTGISMITVGSYDSTIAQYNWLISGNIGAGQWAGSGSVAWTGDPEGRDSSTMDWGTQTWTLGSDLRYTIEGTDVKSIKSNGVYFITQHVGNTSLSYGPMMGTDYVLYVEKEGKIVWGTRVERRYGPEPLLEPPIKDPRGWSYFMSIGSQPNFEPAKDGPQQGTIETVQFPVPEPAAATAMTFFVGCIGLRLLTRKGRSLA